ncbi:RimJ/RimL family protein N-acetyltransferase [Streptomyces sp. B4I13]|uniref:GNAT family N-acetyltransferase n=1 Tax=Streptomyces sp. B4I13 TaxID=3042271 RepID=UPI0027825E41|nr:GNAT family N-acetyltransferase [Streptomyces sp. B4I13]MDQ0956490.1 RimJ/RimL family protein N-acetyltransferase [Streptomyces sp. B4I13]
MFFDLQPYLSGALVNVRPLSEEDRDDLYAVASDPLVWEQHPAPDRHLREEFTRFFREALASGGDLAVIDRKSGQLIGSSRYHGYDPEHDEVEIGWTFLARSHRGGTYNAELKRLMIRHAFQFVGTVTFLVGRYNVRSQRAVERIGGLLSGTRGDGSGGESLLYRIDSRTSEAPQVLSPDFGGA